MTALQKYARLETTGQWHAHPDDPLIEVVLSFGKASIVISDPRTMEALSHWSLPAMVRVNPGQMPACYIPSSEGQSEMVEIEDSSMIDAIETVLRAVERKRPHQGRLRKPFMISMLSAALLGAVFWLPGALVDHAVSVVPYVKRQQIGEGLLVRMSSLTGPVCTAPDARQALDRLSRRIFGTTQKVTLQVVPLGNDGALTIHLPGGLILIDPRLLQDHDTPEALAGHLLVERLRARGDDPLTQVLKDAGSLNTFRLLTSGRLPEQALADQARLRLQSSPGILDAEALRQTFQEARIPMAPWARTMQAAWPERSAMLDALVRDDMVEIDVSRPLLPDADWLALQKICQN